MANSRLVQVLILGTLMFFMACGPAAVATPTATPAPILTPTPVPPGVTPPPATPTPTPKSVSTPTVVPEAKIKYGGILRMATRADPSTWDFRRLISGDAPTQQILSGIFDRLLMGVPVPPVNCTKVSQPGLAYEWKWVNPLTLEVSLTKGVKFHNKPPVNGREMVAADFLYIWNTTKSGDTNTAKVRGVTVEAKDNYTLVFRTPNPYPGLVWDTLTMAQFLVVLPPEAEDPKLGYGVPEKSWIGTGPFMFKRWLPGVKVEMAKNTNYFKKELPYVDGVEFSIIPDQSTRLAAFESGKHDVADRLPLPLAQGAVKRSPRTQYITCPRGVPLLAFRNDLPPFNDVRVRRAISMSLDRDALIKVLPGADGVLIPAGHPTYEPWAMKREEFPPEVRRYLEYHPDEAKRLLREAGIDKLEFTVEWTTVYGSPFTEAYEAGITMLREAGINAKSKVVDYAHYQQAVREGKFQEGSGQLYTMQYSPEAHYGQWVSTAAPELNFAHIYDPKWDKLIAELKAETDEAKKAKLVRDVQIYFVDQALMVNLPAGVDASLAYPYVKNFIQGGSNDLEWGLWYRNFWLDK